MVTLTLIFKVFFQEENITCLHFTGQGRSHGPANFKEGGQVQSYYVSKRNRAGIFGNSSRDYPRWPLKTLFKTVGIIFQ